MRLPALCAALISVAWGACTFDDVPPLEVDASDVSDALNGDAPIDGPGVPAFDVAYPSEWRFSVAGPAEGFILIVNTGPSPLSLATFQVSAINDDHPTAVARVTSASSSGTTLQSGDAGGLLSQFSEALLVGSGLVTEPWVDRTSQLLTLELLSAPPGTYDVAVSLTISLDGRTAELPTTIHVVPGPTVYLDPLVGRRVEVFR